MSLECKRKKRQRQKLARCARKLKFNFAEAKPIPDQSSEKVSLPVAVDQATGEHCVPTPPSTPITCPKMSATDEESTSDFTDRVYGEPTAAYEKIRQYENNKELLKARKYGLFIDDATAVTASCNSLCPFSILNKLPPIEQVTVKKYLDELRTHEKKATFMAQSYREQNQRLKQQILENNARAHAEKEGVRYFWRNQLLEGCSRSGRIINLALMKKKS